MRARIAGFLPLLALLALPAPSAADHVTANPEVSARLAREHSDDSWTVIVDWSINCNIDPATANYGGNLYLVDMRTQESIYMGGTFAPSGHERQVVTRRVRVRNMYPVLRAFCFSDPPTSHGSPTVEATGNTVAVPARPVAPTLGKTVNVAVVNGDVRVDVPGRGGFVPLVEASQVPVGSRLDTRRGTVRLTSARDRRGRTQTGQFGGGIFKVLQGRRSGGLTELRLGGGSFSPCARSRRDGAALRASKRVIRKLSARARRGRFRTRGRYSASTVRGTVWDTIDRCDGTLTRVSKGSVVVQDVPRRRTVVVRAGDSYLARAPGG